MTTPWFASWFDSPYYPILYRHRDEKEAESFIHRLIHELNPKPGATFLDLACGRGRHSVTIHNLGFEVTGVDLSPASIADANLNATKGLRFGVQDMREPFPGKFDFILNLFTSFGYFEHETENMKVLRQVSESLSPQGIFVLDFMNAHKVVAGLVAHESKIINGIVFIIRRRVENGIILKDIHVKDGNKTFDFQERVQALDHNQISDMMEKSGLKAFKAWGDYQGGGYHANSSDRLIMFAKHQN